MTKKIILISILALSTCFVSKAQETFSLHDCMRYAVENAPKYKRQVAQNDNLQVEYRNSYMNFLPEVSGGVGATTNFGRSIDPETNTYTNYTNFSNSYSLSAGMNLFDGFSVVNNYKIAKNAKTMGIVEAKQIEDEICLEVIQAYYNVLYYSEMSDLAQRQFDEANNNLRLTEKQKEQGLKSYADVAEVEASVAEKEYNLIQMTNRCANAYSVLKQVMFFPIADSLSIDDNVSFSIENIAECDVYNLIESAKNSVPSALIAKNNVTEAKLKLKTSKWSLLPSLYASAGYSTGYVAAFDDAYTFDPFLDQLTQRQGEYVQLSLNIPIFSGLQRHSNIRRNKNNVKIAEYNYEENIKKIEVEVELAVQDRDNALKAFVQSDKRVKAQQLAHDINIKRYAQGLISAMDLQTSSNQMLSAEAERLNAFFQFNIKNKVVMYYKGISYMDM